MNEELLINENGNSLPQGLTDFHHQKTSIFFTTYEEDQPVDAAAENKYYKIDSLDDGKLNTSDIKLEDGSLLDSIVGPSGTIGKNLYR